MSVQFYLEAYQQTFTLPADFVGHITGEKVTMVDRNVTHHAMMVMERLSRGVKPDRTEPGLLYVHSYLPLPDLLVYADPKYGQLLQCQTVAQQAVIFMEAVKQDQIHLVEYMLRHGFDPNYNQVELFPYDVYRDKDRWEAHAAKLGLPRLIEGLSECQGIMAHAAALGHLEVLRLIVKYGAVVVNEQPLKAALLYQQLQAVDFLLEAPGYPEAERLDYVIRFLLSQAQLDWCYSVHGEPISPIYLDWLRHLAARPGINWSSYYPQDIKTYFGQAASFFGEMKCDLSSHNHALLKAAFHYNDAKTIDLLLATPTVGLKAVQAHLPAYIKTCGPQHRQAIYEVWCVLLKQPDLKVDPSWNLVSMAVHLKSPELLQLFLQDKRLTTIPDAKAAWEQSLNLPACRRLLQQDERMAPVTGCSCVIL